MWIMKDIANDVHNDLVKADTPVDFGVQKQKYL